MPLEPGTILNHRYRILSILGQGGMGSVYQAMDLNLSVDVAVKENMYFSDEFTRQFKREAAILASLRHPNLPKVTDHFEINGQGQYLVMEYITGEDLRDRMDREGLIKEIEAIHIGSAICDALMYLHSRNPAVIHRDVKPGNIRITDEGHVLLVDFGLAKLHVGIQETTTGARAMTPGYSPPEQYGSARTDPRTDIYSLGATLYSAVCGSAPEDSLARLTDFAKLTPVKTHNPKVSRKFATVIEKAIDLKPDARYQSAEEMKLALLAVVGEKPLSRPITIPRPPLNTQLNRLSAVELKGLNHKPIVPNVTKKFPLMKILGVGVGVVIISALITLLLNFITNSANNPGSLPPTKAAVASIATNQPLPVGLIPPSITESPFLLPTLPYKTDPTLATPAIKPTRTRESLVAATSITEDAAKPSNGLIAFVSTRNGLPQVWLMNFEGGNQRQLTNLKEGACQPDWSPDGKRLIFVSPCQKRDFRYPKSSLFVIDVNGENLSAIDAGFGGNYDPAWSPNGKLIAYTKEIQGRAQVYLLDLETSKIKAAFDDELQSRQPAWSPDGTKLAHTRTKYSAKVWILQVASGKAWQLTRSRNLDDINPVWTTDGSTLYFTQSSQDQYEPRMVAVPYSLDGSGLEYRVPLANYPVPSPAGDLSIAPDGQWIIFESWPDGSNHDIYIMSITGDVVKRLTEDSKLDFQADWQPVTQ